MIDFDDEDQNRPATLTDARRLLGEVDDNVLLEVLAGKPTVGALMKAALWERGDGDHEVRMHHALSDAEGAIVAILARLREEAQEDN